VEWSGDHATWQEAASCCTSYDSDSIFTKVLEATRKVESGEAVYERDSFLFDTIEYTWSLLSTLMWVHALEDRLDVVDFGGSLGSSYRQNRKFLAPLERVEWKVVEQSHFVKAGLAEFETSQLRFRGSIAECGEPNLVLLLSVLCYLENPWPVLEEIDRSTARYILLNRTPFHEGNKDIISIQTIRPPIYDASYPCWLFSRPNFEARMAQNGWTMVESWASDIQPDPKCEHRDYLFRRTGPKSSPMEEPA
jgi:putative methyltransferase (TIGR04325 family)